LKENATSMCGVDECSLNRAPGQVSTGALALVFYTEVRFGELANSLEWSKFSKNFMKSFDKE